MICTVVAGFVIYLGITCAFYLYSRVTLLKQGLAVCLVCSQFTSFGSNQIC